ncbi:hypothetical protein KUCAC02_030118 [Chaenocephalus aceratus]|uniref:Uncharacterized protein n=1 Tax=Chaenocephalus aceratus TaxID=36190 RepID=A0ACB9XIT1_CHAAC|nr:hypothetical protein KUCAC02_030118 [Chaenocephalus aceratus]
MEDSEQSHWVPPALLSSDPLAVRQVFSSPSLLGNLQLLDGAGSSHSPYTPPGSSWSSSPLSKMESPPAPRGPEGREAEPTGGVGGQQQLYESDSCCWDPYMTGPQDYNYPGPGAWINPSFSPKLRNKMRISTPEARECVNCGATARLCGAGMTPDPPQEETDCQQAAGTVCANCHTSTQHCGDATPAERPVCNACGLYFKLHNVNRPLAMKKEGIQTRKQEGVQQEQEEQEATPPTSCRHPQPLHPSHSFQYTHHLNTGMMPTMV